MNHFYVYGMAIDRATNPSLNEYSIMVRGNILEYILKSDLEDKAAARPFFATEK